LVVINVISILWLRSISTADSILTVSHAIWFQIISDLIVLALLVYRVGPLDSPIAFAFLFHIVLACIFFDRHESLRVTLLSMLLFLSSIALSDYGVLPHYHLLSTGAPAVAMRAVLAFSTVLVWGVVWYLASSLSREVRQQDYELNWVNARLRKAHYEKNQQMLRVTHDLKAPFSGIESSIHVLRQLNWNEMSESLQLLIKKIESNSRVLRGRISEILTLGSLRSGKTSDKKDGTVNLTDLLKEVMGELQGLAESKHVTVRFDAADVGTVFSDSGQLKILFRNLLSNAISYSREGGEVDVEIGFSPRPSVLFTDHGIGIAPNALPRIFEDFYRSEDAAAFNPKSTGLGLAIVRQVAGNLQLVIDVDSTENVGTSFRIQFPDC
jgi:two-component system phosphate regulon sensor histidine kinase PhoR